MKKLLYISLTLVVFAFAACKKDPTTPPANNQLSVTPTELKFSSAAGQQLLNLTTANGSSVSWSLTQSENTAWCTPSRVSGTAPGSFSISVTTNSGGLRKTTLTFTSVGSEPVEVIVEQEADLEFGFNGETVVAQPDAWDGVKRAEIAYQLLIYSFADGTGDKIGDLKGITNRLDYIDALGASAIWLSPVHPASSYHGYDVLDYAAVDPKFGTMNDMQALIDGAKARGIKIYIDYVLNHSASRHPWFQSAAASTDSPYRSYYIFSKDPRADIIAGRIAQIATEGAAGYESGQWFATGANAGATGRFKFSLDWTNASSPTITVTTTSDAVDPDNNTSGSNDRFLHFGNNITKRFYNRGSNKYDLTIDFASDWGFLIRTSNTSWDNGTKYGAPNSQAIVEFGVPFTLSSNNPDNIRFSLPEMFHSHFWTDYFADIDYGKAIESDQSPAFKALTEIGDMWVEMGVAGMRLDAVKHIYHNAYNDENPIFLKKFYDRMNASYKATGAADDFYMVGEMMDGANKVAPYYKGLPALFEFDFWDRLKWALQNTTGRYFVKDVLAMRQLYKPYRSDYIAATKLTNHDESRAASELDRSAGKIRVAGTVLLTAQGEPYIYQGEELGYWGRKDTGDENVRTPIMWDKAGAQIASGGLPGGKVDMQMLTSAISVEAQQAEATSLLNHYRTFTKLANTYPSLAKGEMTKHPVYNESNASNESIAMWYRQLDNEKMLVIHNFGGEAQLLFINDKIDKAVGVSNEVKLEVGQTTSRVLMGAYSSVVFKLK